jgi:uncharacterized protein YndB with AHSA1/START domain
MFFAIALTALISASSGVLAATDLPQELTKSEVPWEVKAQTRGVTVHSRTREGSDVKELKTIGDIDAPPHAVYRVLTDLERYTDTMPYTEEARVLAQEELDGKVKAWHFYSVVNAPLVSRRDYTIRIADQSDWRDGTGFLKTYWNLSDRGPAPKDGVVRVKINEGAWVLEPIENGTKTRATYFLMTDPGGSLPTWIVNMANSTAIPDIFDALRKRAKESKYASQAGIPALKP